MSQIAVFTEPGPTTTTSIPTSCDPGLPPEHGLRDSAFASFKAFERIVARCQTDAILPQADTVSLTGLIYATIHGAIDLELGGRASGAKGLGDIDATVTLLFGLLRR